MIDLTDRHGILHLLSKSLKACLFDFILLMGPCRRLALKLYQKQMGYITNTMYIYYLVYGEYTYCKFCLTFPRSVLENGLILLKHKNGFENE